jgi:hypothetical protein
MEVGTSFGTSERLLLKQEPEFFSQMQVEQLTRKMVVIPKRYSALSTVNIVNLLNKLWFKNKECNTLKRNFYQKNNIFTLS